jgi:DNA-binding beta-propeller fold protein YncE
MAEVRQTANKIHRPTSASQDSRASFAAPRPWAAACAGLLLLSVVNWGACKRKSSPPPRPYLAFVANQQGNSVAVVDLGTFQMVSSIPVPPSPTQVAVRPGAKEVYAVSGSGTVSVIAFPELRVIKTVAVGRSAASLVFSPDGRQAYVLDPSGDQVVFVDCQRHREIGRLRLGGKPSSVTLSPDGKVLMADALPSDLYFIDAQTRKMLGTVEVGQNPGPMAVRSDGQVVFVADKAQGLVSAVEMPSRQLLANLAVASPVTSLAPKPDGGEVFALSSEGSVAIILDAFHDDVEQTITTGLNPAGGIFRRDMSVFYIATAGDGNVTALDVQTRDVVSVVHAGTQPSALALTPDERFLVVTDAASSSLAVLRTDSLGLMTTIPVGSDPVHVVVPDWLWEGRR